MVCFVLIVFIGVVNASEINDANNTINQVHISSVNLDSMVNAENINQNDILLANTVSNASTFSDFQDEKILVISLTM